VPNHDPLPRSTVQVLHVHEFRLWLCVCVCVGVRACSPSPMQLLCEWEATHQGPLPSTTVPESDYVAWQLVATLPTRVSLGTVLAALAASRGNPDAAYAALLD
jgi:hypothetical protein